MVFNTLSGVAGSSRMRAPIVRETALMIAGVDGNIDASAKPFAPSGPWVLGTSINITSISGIDLIVDGGFVCW